MSSEIDKNNYIKNERKQNRYPVYNSIVKYFQDAYTKTPNKKALRIRRNGILDEWTYIQYKEDVFKVAKSILKMGLGQGSSVNINCYNSPEWTITFLACVHIKTPPCGVYTTLSPSQCQYLFNTSLAEMVFVEDEEKLKKYIEIKDDIPKCKAIVIMEPSSDEVDYSALPFKVYNWKEFLELGSDIPDSEVNDISSTISDQDIATIVFSSGTTSNPKACLLTHRNCICAGLSEINTFFPEPNTENKTSISYLSLSHIADLLSSIILPLFISAQIIFGDKNALKGSLLETIKETRPTCFFGVPRIWEKMQAKIQSEINQLTGFKKFLIGQAMKIGLSNGEAIRSGNLYPSYTYSLVNRLVFKKLLKTIGLDNCTLYLSGAAPLSKKTIDFFQSIGICIGNCYGLTETTGAVTTESPEGRYGSIGKLIVEGEAKVASDGELLFRGDFIFKGYLGNQDATNEAIDSEGWFHTGDIGRIDNEGFLYVTDRKKDIIITAGGENIAPSLIEGHLNLIPGVDQGVVYGDKQKFLVCLITINLEFLRFLKSKNSYPYKVPESLEEASTDLDLNKYIQEQISEINKGLARVQTIKNFKILPNGFKEGSADSELTPTKKLRRKIVYKIYDNYIKELYGDFYFD
ncbi:hypothetical protein DICPUDRAFT_148873 [Dictyostelium purpureum]|uniref:AMP-dependent synthetase/ligase domain-containing protein n=1 Tax=Dictyostelium purpureum TaxID=5786 RepID=F0ZC81_DICPU|nr:uncharacterized protein DICPUDRAFT_148873 [Dictyostelium purpureum]EGC38477.1 hypothetical protein DICPUDRAFT_148873 [Dictyostelium purpureum]|eukprot:XP_003285035.1 hypothetical protein DICPUDRAFT_148873 [Dictyostelium purpureum]